MERVCRHCLPEHTYLGATLAASRDTHDQGRLHIRGDLGAVYVAGDPDTVFAELDHRASRLGLTRTELLPRYLLTLQLSVVRVLNLTDETTRTAGAARPRIRQGTITPGAARWPEPHGTTASKRFCYPSARGQGMNYADFLDRLKPGSYLREETPDRIEGIPRAL